MDIPKEEFRKIFYRNNGDIALIAKYLGIPIESAIKLKNKFYLRSEIKPIDISRLKHLYLVEKKSKSYIANFFGISRDSLETRIKYCIDEDRDIHNTELVKDLYTNKNYNLTQLLEVANFKAYHHLNTFLNKNNIDNPIKSNISNLYIAGFSSREIAEILEYTEEFVEYNLKHHSIFKLKRISINEEDLSKERIHLSLDELATKYNCSRRTISYYIQKFKLGQKDMSMYFDYDKVYDLYITQNLTLEEVAKELGCCRRTITLFIKKMNIIKNVRTNSLERKIREYLEKYSIQFEEHNRKIIKPYEIDFYLPTYNIGIEVCGLYWHSTKVNADKYHIFKKYMMCRDNNIRLITIFEDEINTSFDTVTNRLNSILKISSNKLYARNCSVRSIDSSTGLKFLNEHHIQGAGKNNIYLGLFLNSNNSLVSVMSFSNLNPAKGGRQSSNMIELNRFVNPYSVAGAASKLYTYFIKNYNYDKVISYCDLRWGTGDLYKKLGFKLVSQTRPNYWYVVRNERKHRFAYTKQKLLSMANLEHSDLTEESLAEELDLYRIYDCGHLKFEWERNENTKRS